MKAFTGKAFNDGSPFMIYSPRDWSTQCAVVGVHPEAVFRPRRPAAPHTPHRRAICAVRSSIGALGARVKLLMNADQRKFPRHRQSLRQRCANDRAVELNIRIAFVGNEHDADAGPAVSGR